MKTWKDIQGWFDFAEVYDLCLDNAKDGGVMVEVGTWMGKSAAYMCEQKRLKNRNVEFVCVDKFGGTQDDEGMNRTVENLGGEFFHQFEKNMKDCGFVYPDDYEVIIADSKTASLSFDDGTLDMVMIDAMHDYASVYADAITWKRKVKVGGYMCFHDFERDSVSKAVAEAGINAKMYLPRTGVWKRTA